VKLLRFLQDGTVTPLGSEKSHRVSVRLLAATHRDLRRLVSEGTFREDLYYRLAGYQIDVPPLRERTSDIPLLVDHFRKVVARDMHRESVPGPSQAVLDLFLAHPWRGNVRELEQVIRRTVIDSGGLVDPNVAARVMHDISPSTPIPQPPPPEAPADLTSLDDAERKHILAVLRATGGNQTQAAFILGIERKTLARKIKRFGITVEETSS
jgi:transcriptional regulator with GAF, ATPase, and Fis domain